MSKPTKDASSLGQLIDDVTSHNREDYATILQICDIINSTAEGPKESVKHIRRRFATNDPSVIKLALILLDTCVKNCGLRFHIQLAHRDFLQDFLRLIKPKNNLSMEIQMSVLGLLQSWAFAFQGFPELKEVIKTYHELKNKNVAFPPVEQNDSRPFNISVQDTALDGETYLAAPQTGSMNTSSSGGASFLIVPHKNDAYARLSPSGGTRQRPPPSPSAVRRNSRTEEGHPVGASYLIVPPSSNAHARLSPSGQRRNKPSPSAERKPLTTDEFGDSLREPIATGPSYLLVPQTNDAYARLSPSGTRRHKPAPSPLAERRPSRTDPLGGDGSLISYERLTSSDASLDAAPSPSTERSNPSVKVSATGSGCHPDQH